MEAGMKRIEDVCADMQIPSLRAAADQVILEFQNSPNVIPLATYILDNSQDSMAQFHSAAAIKRCIIREWTHHSAADKLGLVHYCLNYCLARSQTIRSFVREQLFQTVALVLKSSWLDADFGGLASIMGILEPHLLSDDYSKVAVAMVALLAVIHEFSSSRATAAGFTFEYHYRCRKAFERADLYKVFIIAMDRLQKLSLLGPGACVATPELQSTMSSSLHIAEAILSWDFSVISAGSMRFVVRSEESGEGALARDANASFQPPVEWQGVLADPSASVDLFFRLYAMTLSYGDTIGHSIRQCLILLAGLSGPVFTNCPADALATYVNRFLHNIIQIIDNLQYASETGAEVLATSQMARRLVMVHPMRDIAPVLEQGGLLPRLGKFTLDCLAQVSSDEVGTWCSEALDELLAMWSSLLSSARDAFERQRLTAGSGVQLSDTLVSALSESAATIFRSYAERHVNRSPQEAVEDADPFEDDQSMFESQLKDVAFLGRCSVDSFRLMHQLADTFAGQLAEAAATPGGAASRPASWWEGLNEAVHWLFLLATHLLADVVKGEQPQIPAMVIQISARAAAEGATPEGDPIVQLVNALIRLADLAVAGPGSPLGPFCSPLVSDTVLWFFEHWLQSYLYYNPRDYGKVMSRTLADSYSRNSPAPGAVLDFVLGKCHDALQLWFSEADSVNQVAAVFLVIAGNRAMRESIFGLPRWQALWPQLMQSIERLPSDAQSRFIESLCNLSVVHYMDAPYYKELLTFTEARLHDTMRNPTHTGLALSTLDILRGVAMSKSSADGQSVFALCSGHFGNLITLLTGQHDMPGIVQQVLLVFDAFVEHQIAYLEGDQLQTTCQALVALLRAFAEIRMKTRRSNAHDADEDRSYEIVTLLRTLANLQTRDFSDFSTGGSDATNDPNHLSVSSVIYIGLELLLPLISEAMLQYPNLSEQFFTLVSFMFETYTDKLVCLSPELFRALIGTLDFGLKSFVDENVRLALAAIYGMASFLFNAREVAQASPEHGPEVQAQLALLGPIVDTLLLEQLNRLVFGNHVGSTSLMENASETLFVSICSQQASLNQVFSQFVSRYNDNPKIRDRLSEELVQLVRGSGPQPLTLIPNRLNTTAFRANLEAFLIHTRGFLRVM